MSHDISWGEAFTAGKVFPLVPWIILPYVCFLVALTLDIVTSVPLRPRHWIMDLAIAFLWIMISSVAFALGCGLGLLRFLFMGTFGIEHLLSIGAGIIFILIGLHFTGLLKIVPFYRQMRINPTLVAVITSFLAGLASVFSTNPFNVSLFLPNVGTVLAASYTMALSEASELAAHGTILLAAYAYGIGVGLLVVFRQVSIMIGIPFIVAAWYVGSPVTLVSKISKYLRVVKQAMGVVLVATGLLILTRLLDVSFLFELSTSPLLGAFLQHFDISRP